MSTVYFFEVGFNRRRDCARVMEVSEGSDLGGPSGCHGSLEASVVTQSDIRTNGEVSCDDDMAVSLDQSCEDLAEESDLSQFVSKCCGCELGPNKTPCS